MVAHPALASAGQRQCMCSFNDYCPTSLQHLYSFCVAALAPAVCLLVHLPANALCHP